MLCGGGGDARVVLEWTYDLSLRVITFSHCQANAGHDVTETHEYWRVPKTLESGALLIGVEQAYIIILEIVSTGFALLGVQWGGTHFLRPNRSIINRHTKLQNT